MQIVGGQSIYLHKCHISSFVQLTKLVSNNTHVDTVQNFFFQKAYFVVNSHFKKLNFFKKKLIKGMTRFGAL